MANPAVSTLTGTGAQYLVNANAIPMTSIDTDWITDVSPKPA